MIEVKIFNNAFIAGCIAIVIAFFVWGNLIAFLPWFALNLNLADTTFGIYFTLFGFSQIFVSQIAGRIIIPKFGTTKTLIIGTILFSIAPIIFGLAPNGNIFILASIPFGMAMGMIFPTGTILTKLAEEKTSKILQPLFMSFISIGFLIGALSGGIFQYLGFYPPLVICLLSILSLFIIIFIFYYGLPLQFEQFPKSEKFKLPERKIFIYGLYGFIFLATVGIIGDWSALWFKRDLLTSAFIASLAATAWGLGESIGRLLGSRLIQATNQKFAGAYLGIIGCIVFFITILIFNEYVLLLGIFIFAFCSSNFFPVVIRYALSQTSENLNTAASNLSTISMSGFLIGPAIVGYSASTFGLTFNVKILCFIWILNSLALIYSTRKINY